MVKYFAKERLLIVNVLYSFNPFVPTGQFLALKLIILMIKYLIDILFFKVLF